MGLPARSCSIADCGRRHEAHGYCVPHLRRWKLYGDPQAEVPIRTKGGPEIPCSVDGCDTKRYALGYCRAHHQRYKRYGDPLELSSWAKGDRETPAVIARRKKPGAKMKSSGGYVYVWLPENPMSNGQGFVMEHRLVMSQHLGRPLTSSESVHHRNGIKTDNRLENLELWAGLGKQPDGQRPRELVAYAREILSRYADEVDAGLL